MEKKLSKIVGLTKEEFDLFVESGQLKLRSAKLIPTTKIGDEMALTSVLLSSMRLVTEFRKQIQQNTKMPKKGRLFVFTEVVFPCSQNSMDSRIDGLIIIVESGVIKDATLLEMKKGTETLNKEQIEKYIEIALKFNIPRLITVSNEFVSEPTQFPIEVKQNKSISLYHFSWSYILTVAHLLLFDNDMNISDPDQIEIMKEALHYFEFDKSGVCGFNRMKPGWTKTVDNINAGTSIKNSDRDVHEAVSSWQQEERDLGLMLSRKLGVLVQTGEKKYKGQYKKRFEDDIDELVNSKQLHSLYCIAGAVSQINILGLFEKRAVELSVVLKMPTGKTIKGQIGWLRKQFEICQKKEADVFPRISGEIFIEAYMKNTTKPLRIGLSNIDNLAEELKGRELRECKIIHLKDFGKMFSSGTKFVTTIEQMVQDFYIGIIQNLKKWEASPPKLSPESSLNQANQNTKEPASTQNGMDTDEENGMSIYHSSKNSSSNERTDDFPKDIPL